MPNVGILYICTGRYTVFWPDFYRSFVKNFLPGCPKTFYVFTDAENLEYARAPDVRCIYQKALDWPYSTLKRFAVFLGAEAALAGQDYLFFANANLLCTAPVSAQEVLPGPGQDLTVVRHPGYYNAKPLFFPYDRNPRSRACMPYTAGQVYVAGGLNGGETAAFLALCHELDRRTEADLADGVIARWHDESQLNRYVAENPARCRVLDPGYCAPEGAVQPFAEKILVREKAKWIDVAAVKGDKAAATFFQRKWGAFCENWAPYLLWVRDWARRRKV